MSRYRVFNTNSMALKGVFQGALLLTRVTYDLQLSSAILGSHVGNTPYVLFATYGGVSYANYTFNLTVCDLATYIASYGVTYAASYGVGHQLCSVRSFEWV